MAGSRLQVLLLADSCNPEWPSLPSVGFRTAHALASHADLDVTLVTHVRNRDAILKCARRTLRAEFMDNEYIARPSQVLSRLLRGDVRVGWTTGIAASLPAYLAFEWEVWKRYAPAIRAGRYDLVHRLTPMSPTLPSPLATWCPAPFLLGPLNGGLPWPHAYSAERRREKEWMSYARDLHRLLPFWRTTYTRAAAVFAAFDHTIGQVAALAKERVHPFPEVGYDPELFHPPEQKRSRGQMIFLFVGRLVPYKCPDVVVQCFARSPGLRKHQLWIVGDGPERPALDNIVRQAGAESCVWFLGNRSQQEVAAIMREADVFAFPSIRELGAGVVVEAMASGLACVVVDYGGPGGLISPDWGMKVPLLPKEKMIEQFTAALETLVCDPDRAASLGTRAAATAARCYTWAAKADQIVSVYQSIAGAART